MMSFRELIHSSRRINLLFSVAIIIAICTFVFLCIHELNADNEMHHIVKSDFKKMDSQLEKYISITSDHLSLHNEMMSHLSNHVKNTRVILFSIIVIIAFLGVIGIFVFIYLHRLKNVNNEQLLEELLYYDKLNKLHDASDTNLSTDIKEFHLNRETFINELQQGLSKNQFILYYQPIINIQTEAIVGVEALIRWQHPTHGILSPAAFLPYCENSGLIIPLGEWIFKTAFDQICKWHAMGYSTLSMSINLSSRQLNDKNLLKLIKSILEKNDALVNFIKIEITENTIMSDINTTIPILKSLRDLGIQLSLDDFGTGYSSFNFLKALPISNLKIDKSFISDMTSDITSLGIVESVINLGKNLGLTMTAEGVENINQLHLIKNMKCDFIQGYLYHKPVPANELSQLLRLSENKIKKIGAVSMPNNNIRYEVLSRHYYDQAVNIITQTFCHYEPMTKYLGITSNEFIPFAKLMVEKAINDRLSIVALDANKVCACTIVEDIANPLNIDIHLDSRFKIIFSLLESLAGDFFKERILVKGHIAHLFITAVDENDFGKGLSKKINFESIKLAKENGFDFMCCEFTHEYNEKGTVKNIKNNKLLIRSCNYKDFTFDNKKPFQDLNGSASAYIWELREGAQLQYHINTSH